MRWLDDVPGLTPHGFCLSWEPGLIWLHVGADALTFLAYYSIPIGLIRLTRGRSDLHDRRLSWLFISFILACGTTHLMSIVTLWVPLYEAEGLVKLLTAVLSVATAIVMWPLVPKLLAMPSRVQMDRLNAELQWRIAEQDATNQRLQENETKLLEVQRQLSDRVDAGSYALEVAAEEKRALFENSPDSLCLVGVEQAGDRQDFVFQAFNPATEALLGVEIPALVGKRPQDGLDDEQAAQVTDAYTRCVAGDLAVTYVSERLVGDKMRLFETSLASVHDPRTGMVARIIGVARDVTERAAFEKRLRLIEKMEVTGRLAAGFAHDFNNLLQALMGGLEMLVLDVDGLPREYAEIALQSAQRGAELTHRLLAFSRQQLLQPREVDLGVLLDSLRTLMSASIGQLLTLQLMAPKSTIAAFVDVAQLEAALVNLVVNARDATPQGGCVTLSVETAPAPHDMELPQGHWAVLAVTDTGAGMDEALVQKVCEPFFTTKGTKGTGLGLSMVQGFVRQSGGDMRIHSTPGAGTRIELWLRQVHVSAEEPPAGPGPAPAAQAGIHVLLVDDADDVLVTAAAFLRTVGWRVTRVGSGDEALARLASGLVCDALVTDYSMPGMNGIDVVAEARSMRPGLPALIITGLAGPLARYDGAIDVLRKPFGRQTLVEAVKRIVAADAEVAGVHGRADQVG
jgi:PAS domain S-box-containing protein